MTKIILASSSKGRKELLETAGLTFEVDPSNYDEDMTLKIPATDLTTMFSQGKAEDVAKRYEDGIIIGADSVATLNGEIMGKPYTEERAIEMLSKLSGGQHQFVTGMTIIDAATGKSHTSATVTEVFFREVTDEQIRNYVETQNVLNNAGAYRIQSGAEFFIEKIEGPYSNIIGLPLGRLAQVLQEEFGVDVLGEMK